MEAKKPFIAPELRALMDVEIARYYVGEVEKRFLAVAARNRRSLSRANSLLSVALTVAGVGVAALAAGVSVVGATVLSAAGMGVAAWLLLRVARTQPCRFAGSSVAELGIDSLLPYYRRDCGMNEKAALVGLLCDQLDMLTDDIDAEDKVGTRLMRRTDHARRALFVGLVAAAVAAMLEAWMRV